MVNNHLHIIFFFLIQTKLNDMLYNPLLLIQLILLQFLLNVSSYFFRFSFSFSFQVPLTIALLNNHHHPHKGYSMVNPILFSTFCIHPTFFSIFKAKCNFPQPSFHPTPLKTFIKYSFFKIKRKKINIFKIFSFFTFVYILVQIIFVGG